MVNIKTLIINIECKIRWRIFYFTRTATRYSTSDGKLYAVVNFDLDFMVNDRGRYIYSLCKYLEYAGFNLILKTDYNYIKFHVRFKKLLLQQNYRFVRKCNTPINSIALIAPNRRDKLIKITYGDHATKEQYDCLAPYPLHPDHLKAPTPSYITSFRTAERTMRIFFSGGASETNYGKASLEKKYNIISRYNVLKHLKEHFSSSHQLRVIRDKSELYAFITAQSLENSIIISHARSDPREWLQILSKAFFFIAPPGQHMPWCHNAIEAMAVGTIPITQYANFFDPPLQHNKNCLCYTNYKDLDEVIETALHMEPEEVELMKQNVMQYFDRYLSVESITKRINDFLNSEKDRLNIGVPFVVKKLI